eukprot:CAMPEP_0185785076 /NCGR_PEP_ID=MMETSP1174-20130828/127429_1 /TAXON_ID=35687 /ORGANISM="Dictyocha speculum, Strain CCMP1381" /LENGTH=66 /DNA_ID=CAMNT_0028476989 /DNA_START=98 /DNA_END=298 /DNA_ORIENTATION=+
MNCGIFLRFIFLRFIFLRSSSSDSSSSVPSTEDPFASSEVSEPNKNLEASLGDSASLETVDLGKAA